TRERLDQLIFEIVVPTECQLDRNPFVSLAGLDDRIRLGPFERHAVEVRQGVHRFRKIAGDIAVVEILAVQHVRSFALCGAIAGIIEIPGPAASLGKRGQSRYSPRVPSSRMRARSSGETLPTSRFCGTSTPITISLGRAATKALSGSSPVPGTCRLPAAS